MIKRQTKYLGIIRVYIPASVRNETIHVPFTLEENRYCTLDQVLSIAPTHFHLAQTDIMSENSVQDAALIFIPILFMTFQMVVISALALVAGDARYSSRDTRGVSTREEGEKRVGCVVVKQVHTCTGECVRCRTGGVEDVLWEREREREREREERERRERADKRRGGIWKVMEGVLRRVDSEDGEDLPEQETEEYPDFPAHEDARSEPPLSFFNGLYVPDCGGVKTKRYQDRQFFQRDDKSFEDEAARRGISRDPYIGVDRRRKHQCSASR